MSIEIREQIFHDLLTQLDRYILDTWAAYMIDFLYTTFDHAPYLEPLLAFAEKKIQDHAGSSFYQRVYRTHAQHVLKKLDTQKIQNA